MWLEWCEEQQEGQWDWLTKNHDAAGREKKPQEGSCGPQTGPSDSLLMKSWEQERKEPYSVLKELIWLLEEICAWETGIEAEKSTR